MKKARSRRRKIARAVRRQVAAIPYWATIWPALVSILVALLLGCAIEFLIVPYGLHGTSLLKNLGDGIADAMIRRSASAITAADPHSKRYTFIDIDEETWHRWEYPLVTPRDKLLTILQRLAKSQPLAVVVDIDLSWSSRADEDSQAQAAPPVNPMPPARSTTSESTANGAGPNEEAATAQPGLARNPTNDERLADWLAHYKADAPPLFLMRLLITPHDRPPTIRRTFLDDYVTARRDDKGRPLQLPPNVSWVLPFYDVDRDGTMRYWRLVKPVCQDKAPLVLASAQLAVALALADFKIDVAQEIARLTPPNCEILLSSKGDVGKAKVTSSGIVRFARDGHHWIEIKNLDDALNERIIYTIGWQRGKIDLGPEMKSEEDGTITVGPLVRVASASTVTEHGDDGPLDFAKNSIVIIGGSFESSGDIQKTPLGKMPGALVIVNSIHQLLTYGTQIELSRSWHLAIGFLMVVVNALLFHFLRPAVAVTAALSVVAILMIVTVPYFRSGFALDLEVPSAGVLLHRFLVSLEMGYNALRRDGWRALLRGH